MKAKELRWGVGVLVFLAAIGLMTYGCKPTTDGGKTTTGSSPEVNPKETVIARIGDKDVVTWEEFNEIYHLDRMSRSLTPEQIDKLLENLINQHLVYLDGIARGYDKNPEIVAQVERTKRQLISRYVIRDLSQQTPNVSEEQKHEYYNNNPDKFKVTIINYLLFNERKYNNDRAKAKADAEKALKSLKSGSDLAKVSEEMLDRKVPLSMTLRKDQKSFFGTAFDDAVWNTPEGQMSEILETSQGYIILQVVRRQTQTYEEAEPYIRSDLTQGSGKNKIEELYAELRKKYNVQIDRAVLDAHLPKASPGQPGMPPGMQPGMQPGMPPMPHGAPQPGGMPPLPGQPGVPPTPPPPVVPPPAPPR